MIGLSGLITPSLDEMVFVAREMERRQMTIPLLIGGATTSRQHTAVKIAPEYGSQPVVHVIDASRAVDVVSRLLSATERAGFDREVKADQERVRQQHAALKRRPLLPWPDASDNRLETTWTAERPGGAVVHRQPGGGRRRSRRSSPTSTGRSSSPRGSSRAGFPPSSIIRSTAPRRVSSTSTHARLLDRIVAERLLTVRGVYGFWPAHSSGDDILVYAPTADRRTSCCRFNMLRQQEQQSDGQPEPVARRFRRSARQRTAGLSRRVRDHRRHRRRGAGHGASSATRTTITPSW